MCVCPKKHKLMHICCQNVKLITKLPVSKRLIGVPKVITADVIRRMLEISWRV